MYIAIIAHFGILGGLITDITDLLGKFALRSRCWTEFDGPSQLSSIPSSSQTTP
jgi:hypothetical protein